MADENPVYRYAAVINNIVTNVCLWDGDNNTWTPPDSAVMVKLTDEDHVQIGDQYDGTSFKGPKPDIKVDFFDITKEQNHYTYVKAIVSVNDVQKVLINFNPDQLHQLSSGKTFEAFAKEFANLVVNNSGKKSITLPPITVHL